MKMQRTKAFLANTAVMTVGVLTLRLIHLAFNSWLFTHMGAYGVGQYHLLLTVFSLAVTACTAGFGFAVTRTVAENSGGRWQLRCCAGVAVAISLAAGGLLWALAPALSRRLVGSNEMLLPLRLLCPSLPLMALSAALRGYLIAVRSVVLNSVSELLELLSTIGFTVWLFGFRPPLEALCLGATRGEGLSCAFVVLCCRYLAGWHRLPARGSATPARLAHIAAPVLVGGFVRSGLRSVENLLVPQGLGRYSSHPQDALAQYGTVGGMVMPVLLLPLCILNSAAMLLVPELAEMNASGHRLSIQRTAGKSITLTLWFSFLTTAVLVYFARPIGLHFFDSQRAGDFLRIMAPIVPILYLDSVVDGMLKGLDQQVYSFRYNIIDGLLRVAMAAVLLPWFGIVGYFFLLFASEIFNCALSLWRLVRVARVQVSLVWWLLAPLAASATLYLLLQAIGKIYKICC